LRSGERGTGSGEREERLTRRRGEKAEVGTGKRAIEDLSF
jgi:hypothetical protein